MHRPSAGEAGLSSLSLGYCVAINPLAVAMTQRLPQRTVDWRRRSGGMVSRRAAIRIPSGPLRTAVPSLTSTTVQPGIVAGLVSGAATRGCRIAIAAAGPADGRAPPGNRADGFGMLPTMAGGTEAAAVFRGPAFPPLCCACGMLCGGVFFRATLPNQIAL